MSTRTARLYGTRSACRKLASAMRGDPVAGAFVADELRFLEEMRDIPLRDHVYNMVDALLQTIEEVPEPPDDASPTTSRMVSVM